MLRLDCLRSVYSELEDYLVVTIMGAVSANCSPWDTARISSIC